MGDAALVGDHRIGDLGAAGAVEVGSRLAAHPASQCREPAPERLDVEWWPAVIHPGGSYPAPEGAASLRSVAMPVATTEVRGEPLLRGGRAYVPVARRTEVRLSFRGAGVFARYDRPVAIEVPDGSPVKIVDWDLMLRAALAVLVAGMLMTRRRR